MKSNPTPQERPSVHSGRKFPPFEKPRPVVYGPDALAEALARIKEKTRQEK